MLVTQTRSRRDWKKQIMFADWQLSMNLLHRLKSLTELQQLCPWSGPQLVLDWVCVQSTASAKSQRSVLSADDMLWSLLLLCYFHVWTLRADCSDQSGATLIADGSRAGSSERTRHVIADAQSPSTSNWKSVSLFMSLLVYCCAQEQTQTDVCVCQWPLNAAAHVHLKLSQCLDQQNDHRRYWEAVWKCSVHRQLHQNMQWADSGPLALCLTPRIKNFRWRLKREINDWKLNI